MVIRIDALEIDDHILDKIESKHGVDLGEIEEACLSDTVHVRKTKEELYKVFSKTQAGRYLLIVLVNRGNGIWKVVTARGLNDTERRLYIKARGGR